jgi:hypothetical protein
MILRLPKLAVSLKSILQSHVVTLLFIMGRVMSTTRKVLESNYILIISVTKDINVTTYL